MNAYGFMPHGFCFLWRPGVLWLHVISDATIGVSYYGLPVVILYFIRKREDLPFQAVFYLFGAFILLCGTTHLFSIWVLWHPNYYIEGYVKAATAFASFATLITTVFYLPRALGVPGPFQWEESNRRLKALYEEAEERGRVMLATVVDNLVDGVITINTEGTIESYNAACTRLFGYTAAEVIGQNLNMLIPAPDRGRHNGYIDAYLRTGHAKVIGTGRELMARRKDGNVFPIHLAVSEFRLAGARHFSGIVRDITQQRREEAIRAQLLDELRRSNAELTEANAAKELSWALVASSNDAIVSKTIDGIVTSWNPAAETLFGYASAEMIGESLTRLFPPDRRDEETQILQRIRAGGTVDHFETVRRRKDGTLVPVSVNISPIKDAAGALIGASKIARDITDQIAAKAASERLLARLTDSNTELERFAYVASHDMQEPVRMVMNFSQIVAAEYGDMLDETGRQYLGIITGSATRMRDMVSDLLDYAKLGRESMNFTAVDLAEELSHVRENLGQLITESRAEINSDELPVVRGNPVQLMRLLQNLIANGIKFQPPGQTPKIHVSVAAAAGEWRISVRDNGLGIDEAYLSQIFEPFRRLHAWNNIAGTGLGLSVCRKIAENHGGRIWASSAKGKGSVFFVSLKRGGDVLETARPEPHELPAT
jgi:PAS domain S-box-containing protein